MNRAYQAVIPAAGQGTRLQPATVALPKELLPVVDRPMIDYAFEEAIASGIRTVVVVVNSGKLAVRRHLEQRYGGAVKLAFANQEEPRGLGHAIACAAEHLRDDAFAILLPDEIFVDRVPYLKQLLDLAPRVDGGVIGVQRVARAMLGQYGVVAGNRVKRGLLRVTGLVEKPEPAAAPTDLAIVGRYVVPPRLLDLLRSAAPGAGGEIQLTDGLQALSQTSPLYAHLFTGARFDAGNSRGYLRATVELALRREEYRQDLVDTFLAWSGRTAT